MSRWQLKKAKKLSKRTKCSSRIKTRQMAVWQIINQTCLNTFRLKVASVEAFQKWSLPTQKCQNQAKIFTFEKKKRNPHFVSSLLLVSTFYSTSSKCFNFEKYQDQTRISASRISCNDFTGLFGAVLRKLTGKQWEKSSKNQVKTTGKV